MQQALLDLDAWVATGTRPPASSNYSVGADNGINLPSSAARRRGIQPVVTLSATAGSDTASAQRVVIAPGQTVTFSMHASVPPKAGKIVRAEWDLTGIGTFSVSTPLTSISPRVRATESYTFTKPGTYFPTVLVMSQRNGNVKTPYTLVQNLASVRVVVK